MNEYLIAAQKLNSYLSQHHWNGQALYGPDPIGKVNWRLTRFIKGYLPWLPWHDRFEYSQAQSYWIKAQARMLALTGDQTTLQVITQATNQLVQKQLPNGTWEHPPLRERKGFISTVETVWACLGLATAFTKTGNPAYLDSLSKGYVSLSEVIGFQKVQDGLAINYHAHTHQAIPNVTAMLLWLKAAIHQITGDPRLLADQGKMIRFLEISQSDEGELPYVFGEQPHFQCFQYNAFQFLDLANFYLLTYNERLRPLLTRLASFLAGGISRRSSCRYDCFKDDPETIYWNAALATALWAADGLGLGTCQTDCDRLFQRLLSLQKPDGSFEFSRHNYRFLSDRRSYPRQQAMILNFLLARAAGSYFVV